MEYLVGLTLLLGGESLLVDRAISDLTSKNSGVTTTYLDSAEIELGNITDALAPSLFGEERIIVIREIQDLPTEISEELTVYLAAPEESVDLVLWHKGGVKGKALLDKIKKLSPKIIQCDLLKKDTDKADFIRAEFKRLGRKVSPAAVQGLIDSLGSDLRELSGALSQLASDTPEKLEIDEAAVAKFQQGRIETTGYDVADAAIDCNRNAALLALRNAIETGTDPVMITSALAGSIRTLAKVSGASRGLKAFDLASTLGLPPWQIEKARRQLSKWTPATLAGAVIAIAQADADIKGAAVDPIHSLERAIIAITARV